MKRVLNLGSLSRIVEGDPNEITDDEILVIKDKIIEGKIIDIQKRVDAVVVINGSTTKSIRAAKWHTVTWSVSKIGYVTQSGSDVISGDVLKNITLVANLT